MASSSSASLADSRFRPPQPHLQPSPPPPATASTNDLDRHDGATSPEFNPDHVSVEVLVKHLLSAKQSLSSFGLVMRANDLATHARRMHEESVILSAQTGFLRQGIAEQMYILNQMRRSMQRVYAGGQRDFRRIVRHLDSADGKLNKTIQMLRETTVERVFRPSNEEPKNLMDFVNEQDVHDLRDALKESLRELQNAQTSFDGDLLRFDDDLAAIEKMLKSATSPSSSGSMPPHKPMPHLLAVLTAHSHDMAQHLTSLTRHFDMCVKAVRSTEGGAALARRRAADMTQDNGDPVSISGVITEHESDMPDFEPTMDPHERAEIVQVVVQDAAEVDEVVAEIQAVLQEMEAEFGSLKEQADALRARYVATVNGFQFLDEVGAKLQSYVAAEDEFVDRWENEKDIIHAKMAQMEEIREFYEGYASAYAGLLLELERRRSVEDKIQSTLRKAKETVDAILDADKREREQFTQEIGDYLPTDLWVGMNNPLPRWEFVAVVDGRAELEEEEQTTVGEEPRTPTLANVGLARGD